MSLTCDAREDSELLGMTGSCKGGQRGQGGKGDVREDRVMSGRTETKMRTGDVREDRDENEDRVMLGRTG